MKHWRTKADHRQAQKAGRSGIFDDYRLRVAEVLRDYGMYDRGEVPADPSRPTRRPDRISRARQFYIAPGGTDCRAPAILWGIDSSELS